MKIKMIVGCADPEGSYQSGHEYDVSNEKAKDFINAGFAIAVKESTKTAKVKPTENAKK